MNQETVKGIGHLSYSLFFMSQKALDSLEAAKIELLEAQRKCAWCGLQFPSCNLLAIHVVEAGHRKLPDGVTFEQFKQYCLEKESK